jgi:uncharacterized protein (DUF486 family)
MKGLWSISLLIISNIFMTLAWYGHLQVKESSWLYKWGLLGVILFSWGLALFEYIFQVPANRLGHDGHGGPYTLFQLKVLQEVISLTVFTVIAVYFFKTERLTWNYAIAFVFLVLAVYFVFRK